MGNHSLAFRNPRRPERSLWLTDALDGEVDAPTLVGGVIADVAIVGGGYTGLWTALRIKTLEPSSRVVLIEGDICGGGPSGRNGGFMDPWRAKYFAMRSMMGSDEAIRMIDLSVSALDSIFEFCKVHAIDAQLSRHGSLWVATTPSTQNAWRPTVEHLRALGMGDNYRDLTNDEVVEMTGSDRFLGGVFDSDKGKANPALLARGMRRVAIEQGVEIYEHTPATRIESGKRPRVHTSNGFVEAEKVVLATGPWLGQLRELRNAIAVIGTDMVATERMPEMLATTGRLDELVVSDSRMMVNYFRTTADGRLAWGFGGGSLDYGARIGENMHGISPRPQAVEASLKYHYPQFQDTRITHSWTGPVDRSLSGVPFFSSLRGDPAIIYGGGYSGNGLVPAYVGGHILASMVLDLKDEYGSAGLIAPHRGTFPPEPVRYLGGQLVRLGIARVEAEDQSGRRAGIVPRMLMKLAPPGPAEPR